MLKIANGQLKIKLVLPTTVKVTTIYDDGKEFICEEIAAYVDETKAHDVTNYELMFISWDANVTIPMKNIASLSGKMDYYQTLALQETVKQLVMKASDLNKLKRLIRS